MAVENVEIQERYTKKAVRTARFEEQETVSYLKLVGEKLEVLLGEIKDDREQWNQVEESRYGVSLMPERQLHEGVSYQHSYALGGRTITAITVDAGPEVGTAQVAFQMGPSWAPVGHGWASVGPQRGPIWECCFGARKEEQSLGNGLYLWGRAAGHTVRFLVDTGSGVSFLAIRVWNA